MLQADLKVLGGKFQGKLIPLNTKKFLVGREQDCHLRPNSDLVSRHHCVFLIDDYTVRLRDLGSTNGTKVNGELIRHETVLHDGDNVSIGKLELQLVARKIAAVPAPAPVVDEPLPEADVLNESHATVELPLPSFEVPLNQSAVETNFEMAAFPGATSDQTQQSLTGDTAVLGNTAPMYGMPPGYPAGYPAYPQMQPGMPMPYGQVPGYGMPPGYAPPGYAAYPPGYGMPMQPMYPQPMAPAPVAAPVAAPPAPEPAPKAEAGTIAPPPVRLPPPEETGVRAPAPPPPAAAGSEPAAAAAKVPEKPSTSAADIIKQYMQRRGPARPG